MTDANEALALQAAIRRDHVAIATVGNIVSLLFEPICHRKLERQKLARTDRQWIIHYTIELSLASVGTIEAHIRPRTLPTVWMCVDRVVVWPTIVCLPCVIRALKKHVGWAIIGNDEDNVTLPVRFVSERNGCESPQVNTAEPIGRNGQRDRWFPKALVNVLCPHRWIRLCRAIDTIFHVHQSGTTPTVVSHSEHFEFEISRGIRGNHNIQLFSSLDALF